ncbi:DUF2628 domain-containing protein [Thorsellia anophelis]|uniref:Uncharacterized protein n=1 Tax=Thorsellia anophelis DSM 18579 TaxID=1123402 RepID=A0A1I0EPA9_9GAMM|nr:DUF2628 domain-containing protein [Thorsellia anophelis]SET47086.1 Protein of unknown function [Thorsellia anophelis DSM 18579]
MKYSNLWQLRFDFYNTHGLPTSKNYTNAFKGLTFFDRFWMNMNIGAFFLSFIYFIFIGRPKQALTIFLTHLLIVIIYYFAIILFQGILTYEVVKMIGIGLNICLGFLFAQAANVSYYMKEIKGEPDNFNPFKHIKFF